MPIGAPWQAAGRNAAPQLLTPPCASVGQMVMNAGRFSFSRAEAVGDPRAHARPHEVVAAGVQLEQRAAVRRVRAVQRVDEAEVIDALRDVREQLAHRQAALAVLLELPRRLQQLAGLGERARAAA